MNDFTPDYAFPPGSVLEEWIDERGITQVDLAHRLDMSAKTLNQIIRGHAPITQQSALALERVTGIAADTWMSLEAGFRTDLARIADRERLSAEVAFLDDIPVAHLRKRGFITASARDKVETLVQVLRFFGTASPDAWRRTWGANAGAAFRQSAAFSAKEGAIAAWLRIGEIEAAAIDTPTFDASKLRRSLPLLRDLTRDPEPARFQPALDTYMRDCGVVLLFVPDVPGTRCSGATRWLNGRPVVQISLRYRSDDQLWFTVFHELAHVLLHSRRAVFIEDPGSGSGPDEDEANAFASELLIPRRYDPRLNALRSLASIRAFASDIGTSPGIVVGRLQHDGVIGREIGNGLKARFRFREDDEQPAQPQ